MDALVGAVQGGGCPNEHGAGQPLGDKALTEGRIWVVSIDLRWRCIGSIDVGVDDDLPLVLGCWLISVITSRVPKEARSRA